MHYLWSLALLLGIFFTLIKFFWGVGVLIYIVPVKAVQEEQN